jgi:hypothetical protein
MQHKFRVHFYTHPNDNKRLRQYQLMQVNKVLNMRGGNYKNNDNLIDQHSC